MDFLKYIKDITLITMTLFVVIDIVGSIPVILDLKKKAGALQAGKAAWAAGIIMILFVFFGEGMLHYIGISVNAFAVAGALVIFFFAMEMILGIQLFRDEQPETASIVPLAFPLIAGGRAPDHDPFAALAVFARVRDHRHRAQPAAGLCGDQESVGHRTADRQERLVGFAPYFRYHSVGHRHSDVYYQPQNPPVASRSFPYP